MLGHLPQSGPSIDQINASRQGCGAAVCSAAFPRMEQSPHPLFASMSQAGTTHPQAANAPAVTLLNAQVHSLGTSCRPQTQDGCTAAVICSSPASGMQCWPAKGIHRMGCTVTASFSAMPARPYQLRPGSADSPYAAAVAGHAADVCMPAHTAHVLPQRPVSLAVRPPATKQAS